MNKYEELKKLKELPADIIEIIILYCQQDPSSYGNYPTFQHSCRVLAKKGMRCNCLRKYVKENHIRCLTPFKFMNK